VKDIQTRTIELGKVIAAAKEEARLIKIESERLAGKLLGESFSDSEDLLSEVDPIYDAGFETGHASGVKEGKDSGYREKVRTVFSLNLLSEDTLTIDFSPKGLDEWRSVLSDRVKEQYDIRVAPLQGSDRITLTVSINVFLNLFSIYADKSVAYIASLFDNNSIMLNRITLEMPKESIGECKHIVIRGDN